MCGLSYAEQRIPSEVIDYGFYSPFFLNVNKCQTMLTYVQNVNSLPSDRFNNSKVVLTEAIIRYLSNFQFT